MARGPVLFLFLDGVGLGSADAAANPFHAADLPNLLRLLDGKRLDSSLRPFHGDLAWTVRRNPPPGKPPC
jgi:hypothetical protein